MEKHRPVRMLLLGDSGYGKFVSSDQFFRAFVPPGHVFPAARSPGGVDVEHDFLSRKVLQRECLAIVNRGQCEGGPGFAG